MRFQFNGSGNLIGVGLQLTGMNGFQGSGLSIPPNTFAGFSQLSAGGPLLNAKYTSGLFKHPIENDLGCATSRVEKWPAGQPTPFDLALRRAGARITAVVIAAGRNLHR